MIASDSVLDQIPLNTVEKNVIRKKVTEREVEKCEVAQLSFHSETRSKNSNLAEKLEEKRKIRHENLLARLALSLHEVNTKTEKNIKMSSVELKSHFKHFDDKLEEILTGLDKPEAASYCNAVFLEIQNKAKGFKREQERLVKELHEDLIKFENERAVENEKLLHWACEEIRKIGYFLPYEVQTFVEHETLKMNELSLNNRRCYEDLKLTLTLLMEQSHKSFIDKVFCIQEKWVQIRLQGVLQNLQSAAEKKIAGFIPEAYARLELKGCELAVQLSPDNLYSTCKPEEWSRNVEEVLATIENYGKGLIDVCKNALKAVCFGSVNKVEDVKNELNFLDTLSIEERVIKPVIFEAQNDQAKEIEGLEMFWQDTLLDIKSSLKEVTQFLLEAGKLLERHLERIRESKRLLLRALERANKNKLAYFQDAEIKLNIALDNLRQEHNLGKLEKAHEAVLAILNSLKAKYESIYLDDTATIEDFYRMMDLEADVFSAELKEFIYEIHPEEQMRNTSHYFVDKYRYLPQMKPIFREVQICIHRIQAVRTWKFGFWKALETLSEKTREALEPTVESWVKKKIESLAEWMSIEMELLDKRFPRIKMEMFEKRQKEIESHQNKFEKHKEKIKISLAQMKEDLKAMVGKEVNRMNSIKESLNEIEGNAKLENRPGILRGNHLMMERKREELESELKSMFERFRVECEVKTADMRQTNIHFMKSIRFFHESGNYSTEEGKMFMTMLEAVDKEINNELKNILRDSTKEEAEFVKRLSLLFGPPVSLMIALHEEAFFHTEIQERLKNFGSEIRDVARTVKLNFDQLRSQSESLRNSVQNMGKPVNEIDEQLWDFVIRLFYRNVSNLFYPVVYPETPDSSAGREEKGEFEEGEVNSASHCCCAGKLSLHITISKTATFHTNEKAESFTWKDYRSQLFHSENPPENNGTFMAVVSNAFWTEMDFLQRAAFNFYRKLQGRKIMKDDLIAPNYEVFSGEILAKFKCYNIQVEQFWLRMMLDFLPVVECLKWTANRFLERKLQDYRYAALKALEEYECNFRACLECQTCENVKEMDALDRKLLPLHGYPGNVGLLDQLEEEVVRKTANQRIKWEAGIKRFKNQVRCFRFHHLKELTEIKAIEVYYLKLRDKIFTDDFGHSLLEAIMEYCNRGGFCTNRSSKDQAENSKSRETGNDSQVVGSGEVPSEHDLNFDDLVGQKLHGVPTYLNQLRRLVERERLPDPPPPECSPCRRDSAEDASVESEDSCWKYCQHKTNVLLPIVDFGEPVAELLVRLDERLRNMRAFAVSQESFHEEILLKWLNVWKSNVKKISKLYRVKYEEKPTDLAPPVSVSGELTESVFLCPKVRVPCCSTTPSAHKTLRL